MLEVRTRWSPMVLLAVCVACTGTSPVVEAPPPTPVSADTDPVVVAAPVEDLVPESELPAGVTRSITVKPDGTEHVDLTVDLKKYDMAEVMHPAPFGVAEMRNALTAGTVLSFKIGGEQPKDGVIRWTVDQASETGVVITFEHVQPSGQAALLSEERIEWRHMNTHSAFPKANTAASEGDLTIGAGTFPVWIYEVDVPGTATKERFHFAKTFPGPPVLHQVLRDGREVRRMELVSLKRPSPSGG